MIKEIKNNELYFSKVKPNAIIPTKRDEDAGMDVYACFEEEYIVIPAHTTIMIPTGIASAFSQDYVAILKERGSTGTKGMGQRAGIIDSGYRNEWLCPITNTNEKPIIIAKDVNKFVDTTEFFIKGNSYKEAIVYPYEKAICQVLFVEVPKMDAKEVNYEDLKNVKSERGLGKLGSSGK